MGTNTWEVGPAALPVYKKISICLALLSNTGGRFQNMAIIHRVPAKASDHANIAGYKGLLK
jgi:hypothetical protein